MTRLEAADDDQHSVLSGDARIFIFGCGYSALRFAEAVGPDAIEGVTTRSSEKAATLAARGFRPFLFSGEAPGEGIDAALHRATHILVSIPPGHEAPLGVTAGGANAAPGDSVLRWYRDTIAHGSPKLRWIGYLSTIGVYGNHDGAWIDETTATEGGSARARERIAAEEAWREVGASANVETAILRLSGIYGPGRNAFRKLVDGTARRIVKPGQVFNRIHVDDIAGACLFLAERHWGGTFNVTDDEPAPPQDVIEAAARMAGLAVPPDQAFDPATMSPMARSFWNDNKRVSSQALREQGYVLRYPTYREGLAALLAEARDAG